MTLTLESARAEIRKVRRWVDIKRQGPRAHRVARLYLRALRLTKAGADVSQLGRAS